MTTYTETVIPAVSGDEFYALFGLLVIPLGGVASAYTEDPIAAVAYGECQVQATVSTECTVPSTPYTEAPI